MILATKLRAYGTCKLNLDGYESAVSPIVGRYYGITIDGADGTTDLIITGDGGKCPIRNISTITSSAQLKIHLTNWTSQNEYFNNSFLPLGFTAGTDVNFCTNITATAVGGANIVPGC